MTYEAWKSLQRTRLFEDEIKLRRFERDNPETVSTYRQRSVREDAKRRKIMAIEDADERQMEIAKNMKLFWQEGIHI